MALGADNGRVFRLVLKEGAMLVMMGLLIGAPGIYFAGGVIRGGLLLVTIATCYVPALRALTTEPAASLRQE